MASQFELLNIAAPAAAFPARHVTLVRGPQVTAKGSWSSTITPSLGLAYLAAMLEQNGTRVAVVDGLAEGIDQVLEGEGFLYRGLTTEEIVERIDPATDVIGLSCMFSQEWPWTRQLMEAIRARFPLVPIVAGGEHVTAMPKFSLEDCPALSYCVLGEGEETIVELINNIDDSAALENVTGIAFLRDGQFVQTPPRRRIRAVDDIPLPAWHLFPMEVYLDNRNAHGVFLGRTMGILATRGCPYKCTFCSNPVMYGNLWMPRSPASVLDEIELYMERYGATNIDFYDLTFILRRTWILEFCRLIEERGLKFTWQLPTGTRSEVIDSEVSAALYRTGCRNVTYAPESGSARTLESIKKQVDLKKLSRSIRSALGQGITVKMNLVLGFPDETRRDILATVWFVWKMAALGVHDAAVFIFSPYPGSALFDELEAEGRIGKINDDYFQSLVAITTTFSVSDYCRAIPGRELSFWRFFAMSSFFGLSFLLRPWRFVRLLRNLVSNEARTTFEQRVGAILRRPATRQRTNSPLLYP